MTPDREQVRDVLDHARPNEYAPEIRPLWAAARAWLDQGDALVHVMLEFLDRVGQAVMEHDGFRGRDSQERVEGYVQDFLAIVVDSVTDALDALSDRSDK